MRPSGDLRAGGTSSVDGNASGEILRCQPPRLLPVALDSYLRGQFPDVDPAAMEDAPDIVELSKRCGQAWAAVLDRWRLDG